MSALLHALPLVQHLSQARPEFLHHLVELGSPTPTKTNKGEQFAFWTLGPLAVICALGMILAKNAVHAALLLVVVMFNIAVFYVLNQAPFLGAVEIIVYAGAIMILFLFVLMLVGVDSSDSLVETLRGQRAASLVLGLGFVAMMVGGIGHAVEGIPTKGLDAANDLHNGNVQGIARLLFTDYVFPFEVVSALLIIAAVGAMVLGHRERDTPRPTQRELMRQRLADYRDHGDHPGSLPGPGVFATRDDATARALLPSGAESDVTVPPEYALDPVDNHEGYANPAHELQKGTLG